MSDPGNCVMYYVKDGPERAFVKEELMLIGTKLPPDYVKNGNAYITGIGIASSSS